MFDSPKLRDRLRASVDDVNGCWLWRLSINRDGYGAVGIGSRTDGTRKLASAHRVSWQAHIGPIPAGLCVLHRCDKPACINPDHLFLGSQKDNMTDCLVKGRHHLSSKTHCKHGHALTPDNVLLVLRDGGHRRHCLQCKRLHDRAYRADRAYAKKPEAP